MSEKYGFVFFDWLVTIIVTTQAILEISVLKKWAKILRILNLMKMYLTVNIDEWHHVPTFY